MAKKQTFEDKLSKTKGKKNSIKLIRSKVSKTSGAVRFSEDVLQVPDGESPENFIKKFIQSK